MKTIIIILGAARSGSTLMAKAIGGHSKCFALGEINRFNLEINDIETHCGCGEKLNECNFWKDIIVQLKNQTKAEVKGEQSSFNVGIFKQITKKNKIYKLLPTIFYSRRYANKEVNEEIENTLSLYKNIFDKTQSEVLIDSTKGLFRALILASRSKKIFDFKFIQLTRDGRGVLNSSMKTSFKLLDKHGEFKKYQGQYTKEPQQVIRSWLYINLRNFIVLKLFRNNKTYFVKYENFTAEPSKHLKQIYSKVHLEYEKAALDLGGNENHILGGNASRINAKVIKKQDDAWKEKLDKKLLLKFSRTAGWFNKILGY